MSSRLDDLEALGKADPQGMLEHLVHFDRQLEEAARIGAAVSPWPLPDPLGQVVLVGMGGSAIGGDLLRCLLFDQLAVPFLVLRGYQVPAFASRRTLALVCSYSGNTEETLSCYEQLRERGAQVICLTSGGRLAELASAHSHPCLRIPSGLPPRAALGYSLLPLLGGLGASGLIPDPWPSVRELIRLVGRLIEEYSPEVPRERNPAKELATSLQGRLPLIYASQDHLEVVAVRWRGQFSENGKQVAYSASLPEMNHNEIVGWRHPREVLQQSLPIFLRDREDHPRVQLRFEITRRLLQRQAPRTLEYWSSGESRLERLFSLILLGDFASFYLAVLNGEDPTPVEVIDYLKESLARES